MLCVKVPFGAVENVVGGKLHEERAGAVATTGKVKRGVEVGAAGGFRIVLAGVEIDDGCAVHDGFPGFGEQLSETRRIGDVGFSVCKRMDIVPGCGEFRLEVSAEESGCAEE